jgi:hypothetical protein
MNRNALRLLGTALSVVGAAGCGGKTVEIQSFNEGTSSLGDLKSGAILEPAYFGVDGHMPVGGTPVVATVDLLGGSRVELEVVTPDASPVRFEVWRVRGDGTATLEIPVDASSGFALENVAPEEDGTWAIRFPATTPGDVIVHMDCVGGLHGCAKWLQPGDFCPVGWQCAQGLTCQLPVGVCGPLAGVGKCVDIVAKCGAATDEGTTVCGCDGQSYPTECAARLAGATVLHEGFCERAR